MAMETSSEQIDPDVLQGLVEQRNARRQPSPEILEDLQLQKRLREGDYPATTVVGAGQSVLGAGEVLGKLIVDFAAAAPGAVVGLAKGLSTRGAGSEAALSRYVEGFEDVAEPVAELTNPRSVKGKRYQGAIEQTYNKYINEKWGDYVGGLVEQGYISPAEGAYYRTSADALLMGLLMRGGRYMQKAGEKTADIFGKSRKTVDLDATTDVVPTEAPLKQIPGQKRLTGPESEVATAVKGVLDGAEVKLLPAPDSFTNPKSIFRNRQAGAVDPEVFIEVASKIARPGVVTAKMAADLSHALARQIGFKHVTDIRKIESPTAKMLADRIMPLEDSKIPLGAGFHERISLKEGEYTTRIDNVLEPLRKHVINRNATKTLRLVALPKRINDDLFSALDTGKAPEYIVPAAKALRAVLNDIWNYQTEAGVDVGRQSNYIPHMWDAKKIARTEWGRKNGGAYTRYLMEQEGLDFNAAQEVIATLTHEEGFLDFVEDTGGRLAEGEEYGAWAGRVRSVGGGPAKPGFTKSRVLKGDFPESKDWLITDVESVMTSYINRAARHAEYTRLAGPGERDLNRTVLQILEEQQLSRQKGGKLKASSPHETAQEIYDVFDALQGRFRRIKNPAARRASQAIAGYEVIQKLGLVALAQFPETMMPAARWRVATATKKMPGVPIPLKSYAVGMVDSIANGLSAMSSALTGKRLIPKTEVRKHLERIGVVYTSALQSSASRMAGPTGIITNRAIRAFQMETITNLQRTVAYDTINSIIRENSRYLAKGLAQGKRERMYRQELIELGIEPEQAIEWYRNGMPSNHPISQKFDIALVRGIDTNIIMPKAANAPRLYNDQRFQLPLIFTRFFTAFGNTVLKNLGKKFASSDVTNMRKIGSLSALVAAVGIAYYTQFLREAISGYEYREEDDPMRVVDAYDRAGLTAMFTRLYPLFSSYKYGQGAKVVSGVLGGPFASDVAGFYDAAKSGKAENIARYMARQTPILTITPQSEDFIFEFYLEMIEAAEDAID